MKPDWKDAPKWARWLAMDSHGRWIWFQHKPIEGPVGWMVNKAQTKTQLADNWKKSTERKPRKAELY